MVFVYFNIDIIHGKCGYYAEFGVAVPLDECLHFYGSDLSFKYMCTIHNNTENVSIVIYPDNHECAEDADFLIGYKNCSQHGITCNCDGIGSDCHTLKYNGHDYKYIDNESDIICDDGNYTEWTYVINTCVNDGDGGSTKLACDGDNNFKRVQYHEQDCNGGGIDITQPIDNCAYITCPLSPINNTKFSYKGRNCIMRARCAIYQVKFFVRA